MQPFLPVGTAVALDLNELEWLLDEDRWQQVGPGYQHINNFLKTIDLSPFNMEATQRKALAKRLEELQASQRATARALGVSHTTIQKGLHGNKLPPHNANTYEMAADDDIVGNNLPLIREIGLRRSGNFWYEIPQQDIDAGGNVYGGKSSLRTLTVVKIAERASASDTGLGSCAP